MTAPLLITLIVVYVVSILGIVAADSLLEPPRATRDLGFDPARAGKDDDLLPADR
jgi:hypothetical protein